MKKLSIILLLICSVSTQAQFSTLLEKAADKKAAKARAKAPDFPNDGVTSPIHQKYMNKIVFALSDAGMEKGKEDETKFVNKFTLGEPVVFRVYMNNSLANLLKGRQFNDVHSKYVVKYYLDDVMTTELLIDNSYFTKDERCQWTTWRGALKSPDGDNRIGILHFNTFVQENENKLTPGEHKFKMEIYPHIHYPEEFTAPVVATGEITMVVKNSVVDKNDTKACLPKALMTDKALEAKILAAFKAQGWKEVPKEVRITSSKWTIVRHQYTGVILSRYVEAYVGSTRDGKCIKQSFNFYQDHDGSNYQSEVYLKGIGDQRDISCGCLKP